MPSPFPGMDPFLEFHWGDVHTSLTTYAPDQLRRRLPNDLRARVQEFVHLHTDDVQWTERWIEIRDSSDERLITSIEFLSLGNKETSAQRNQFQAKQQQLLQAGVNLVEIDLLRRGGWALSVPESQVPDSHAYPYRIVVVRRDSPTRAECYETPLQGPLPNIRIPLRPGDEDVVLELQPLIAAAWEEGDYADIDYAAARRPRFNDRDEAWIDDQIARRSPP